MKFDRLDKFILIFGTLFYGGIFILYMVAIWNLVSYFVYHILPRIR